MSARYVPFGIGSPTNSDKPSGEHNNKFNLIKLTSYVPFGFGTPVSIGIAACVLWGLLSVYDPAATLHKLQLNEAESKVSLSMGVKNPNFFRGYNYTYDYCWADLFYIYNDNHSSKYISYSNIPNATKSQRFRKTWHWNLTFNISTDEIDLKMLKSQASHFYVSLHLTYSYRILLWLTKTKYQQWLDVHALPGDILDIDFDRTQNLTLAMSV